MRFIEDVHQKNLVQWADLTRLNALRGRTGTIGQHLIHIPNGGKRNAKEAARLKSQGVRAGFPDLFLFIPSNDFCGLAIEMKRPIIKGHSKPAVSKMQKDWLKRLSEQNYKSIVCYGWNEARLEILNYLNLGK